jgi:hypothetical protein
MRVKSGDAIELDVAIVSSCAELNDYSVVIVFFLKKNYCFVVDDVSQNENFASSCETTSSD